jgi:hypothetical protein
MRHIDISVPIRARTKGQVERAYKTLQDRPVKELRLRQGGDPGRGKCPLCGVHGRFYNARFSKPPANKKDPHRPLRARRLAPPLGCPFVYIARWLTTGAYKCTAHAHWQRP